MLSEQLLNDLEELEKRMANDEVIQRHAKFSADCASVDAPWTPVSIAEASVALPSKGSSSATTMTSFPPCDEGVSNAPSSETPAEATPPSPSEEPVHENRSYSSEETFQ